MAELLAANQITIAKVLDGEKGEKGEMSAEQLAQLNQASEDASQAKTDVANLEIGGRNYIVKKDSFSATVNGITLDYDGEVYHIYGTNTKTDAAYGIGGNFIEKPNVFEPGAVYTVSTTTPLPRGLYLGINTRNSSGTGIQAGSNAWLYGDGNKTSNTFTCTQDTNGTLIVFFGVKADCGTVDVTFKIKLEKGNRATDWTPAPEDVDAGIKDAAKVATNFIGYDSTNGLVLGNKESGSWVGYRTQIDNDSFNVLDENGNIIASYGSNEIELGKGNPSAIIKMCDSKAYIKNYIVGSENTSVFCGQNTTAVGEWDGASESYAFFKQGYAYIGQSSSSIKFSSLSPNKNDIIMEGRTITINGQLALGTALSIANGGTGATTAAAARANLGLTGVETKTLLWTNARPTSNFAAQELSLDLSGYSTVEIQFAGVLEKCLVGMNGQAIYLGATETTSYSILRSRIYGVTANGITFNNAVYKTSNSDTSNVLNTMLIPIKIYGIKEV